MQPRMTARAAFLAACLFPALSLLAARSADALTISRVPGTFNDVVYNPLDGSLYASASSIDSLSPNRVLRIDPLTAQVTGSLPVGSGPNRLALSSDGTALYVGLDGSGSVRRVNLPAFTAGSEFSLGSDPFYGTLYAEDIAVQPGSADVVVVALRNAGFSPRHMGVAAFDHGVARPNRESLFLGSNAIVFSASPTRLYGQDNESTEAGFRRMDLDANGITVVDMTTGLLSYFGRDMEFEGGFVYSGTGQVVDPAGPTLVHQYVSPDYSYPTAVAVDGDQLYYATNVYAGVGGIGIHILGRTTFTPIMRYTIYGVGQPTVLRRWGTDGLAVRADDGSLRVLNQVFTPPTCELGITKTDIYDPVSIADPISYRLDIMNRGEALAENIVVRDTMPANTQYQYAYSTNGYCYDSSGVIVCVTGALAPNDSFYVNIGLRTFTTGFVLNRAYVTSSTPDAFGGNNMDGEVTEVVDVGFDQADVEVAFVGPIANVMVEGQPVEQTVEIRNNGPATAQNVSFSGFAYGVPLQFEVVNGGSSACSTYFNNIGCNLGNLAPGDTRSFTFRILPFEAGFIYTSYAAYPFSTDPNYGNNFASAFITVLPSATRLLDSLAIRVSLLDLHHGPEMGLLKKISSAKAAIAVRDTGKACEELAELLVLVSRRSGRALDLDEAYSLFSETRFLQLLLGCIPGFPGGGDSLRFQAPAPTGGDVTNLPGRHATANAATAKAALPTRLELITGAPGTELSPTVAMPEAGHARLDLIDVQGRLVRTVFDGELPAGTYPMAWRGTPPGSGIYFYRLLALQRQVVTKVSVVR